MVLSENSKILTLYDVMKIQDFIFSTNKLRENLGSSFIVENVLKNYLDESIRDNCKNYTHLDYKRVTKEELNTNIGKYDAIIVYIAGGNALVLYSDNDILAKVNQAFSKQLLIETGGLLSIAVASVETNLDKFQNDRDKLELLIEKNKRERIQSMPLLGIGITKEELSTGLPAQYEVKIGERPEFFSYPTVLKWQQSDEDPYEKEYLKDNRNKYKFPKRIDYLGQKSGENYIALIHIDGNDMGRTRKKVLKGTNNYAEALLALNEFSVEIMNLFKNTMRKTINELIFNIEEENLDDTIECKPDEGSDRRLNLPIRPLILNGDDITIISNGKLGINLAEHFLKNLYDAQKKITVNNNNIQISASAGVLIINSKFPFHRAYGFAEELCRSAKINGKILEIANRKINGKNIDEKEFVFTEGCWLDFHITQSTLNINLDETRRNLYNVIGLKNPGSRIETEFGVTKLQTPLYNLIWRPWCVESPLFEKSNESHVHDYNWKDLKSIINHFIEKKWSRNKLIKLKKAMLASKELTDQFKIGLKRTDFTLPVFRGSDEIWREDQYTPYFDALEMMDFYVKLKELRGEKNN